jgi:hypothetical protein
VRMKRTEENQNTQIQGPERSPKDWLQIASDIMGKDLDPISSEAILNMAPEIPKLLVGWEDSVKSFLKLLKVRILRENARQPVEELQSILLNLGQEVSAQLLRELVGIQYFETTEGTESKRVNEGKRLRAKQRISNFFRNVGCLAPDRRAGMGDYDSDVGLYIDSLWGRLNFDSDGYHGSRLDPADFYKLTSLPDSRSWRTDSCFDIPSAHNFSAFSFAICSCSPLPGVILPNSTFFGTPNNTHTWAENNLGCAASRFKWAYDFISIQELNRVLRTAMNMETSCDFEFTSWNIEFAPSSLMVPKVLILVDSQAMEQTTEPNFAPIKEQTPEKTTPGFPPVEGNSQLQQVNKAVPAVPETQGFQPHEVNISENDGKDLVGFVPDSKKAEIKVDSGIVTVIQGFDSVRKTVVNSVSTTVFVGPEITFGEHSYRFDDSIVILDEQSRYSLTLASPSAIDAYAASSTARHIAKAQSQTSSTTALPTSPSSKPSQPGRTAAGTTTGTGSPTESFKTSQSSSNAQAPSSLASKSPAQAFTSLSILMAILAGIFYV